MCFGSSNWIGIKNIFNFSAAVYFFCWRDLNLTSRTFHLRLTGIHNSPCSIGKKIRSDLPSSSGTDMALWRKQHRDSAPKIPFLVVHHDDAKCPNWPKDFHWGNGWLRIPVFLRHFFYYFIRVINLYIDGHLFRHGVTVCDQFQYWGFNLIIWTFPRTVQNCWLPCDVCCKTSCCFSFSMLTSQASTN